MELTDRQKLTIQHLKDKGIEKPFDIIKFCLLKLPLRRKETSNRRIPGTQRRRHSQAYYQGIIDYLEQNK